MKIIVAGATGYLGSHIVQELMARQINFQAIARNPQKLEKVGLQADQIIKAEVTRKEDLSGILSGADVVISSLGITRQKDGLSYMDVDYQANKNLLEEAIKSGVKKFIYVSVLGGESLTHLQICAAKERFVRELKTSGLVYSIIRPSGFFSDLEAFYKMAQKGRIYLFGDGEVRMNPIHGADLAKVCVDAIDSPEDEIKVGGPEILSQRSIAETAFQALGKATKLTFIPDWVRRLTLRLARIFLSKAQFGPVEFFLNVMIIEMTAPSYGIHRLSTFFEDLKQQS